MTDAKSEIHTKRDQKQTPFKTSFFQFFRPEALTLAIRQGNLTQVKSLLDTKKASIEFSYGSCPALMLSLILNHDHIVVVLLDKYKADPNAKCEFLNEPERSISENIFRNKDLSEINLLGLYGAKFPLENSVSRDLPICHIVAVSAEMDHKKRRELEVQLESSLKEKNSQKVSAELCQQLADFWEKQCIIDRQFPRGGSSVYQKFYQEKAKDYCEQKKLLLALQQFPEEKKNFFKL